MVPEKIDGLKTEDRRPKTEDVGSLKTEDGRQKTEDQRQKLEIGSTTTQTRRSHSALSMKSLTEKKVSTKKAKLDNLDTSNLPTNPFSTTQIQDLWKKTIEKFNNKGDKLLASLMSSCTPIANKNLLEVTLPSKLMKADLEKYKLKILPFLREELQNYKIDFDITVNEEAAKKFAYTPEEKYAYLKDKNPLISILKQTFHLDL